MSFLYQVAGEMILEKVIQISPNGFITLWYILVHLSKKPWFFSGSRMDPQNESPSNIHLLAEPSYE